MSDRTSIAENTRELILKSMIAATEKSLIIREDNTLIYRPILPTKDREIHISVIEDNIRKPCKMELTCSTVPDALRKVCGFGKKKMLSLMFEFEDYIKETIEDETDPNLIFLTLEPKFDEVSGKNVLSTTFVLPSDDFPEKYAIILSTFCTALDEFGKAFIFWMYEKIVLMIINFCLLKQIQGAL